MCVKYFREFGCPVYSLIREPNKGKFQCRSKKGIFIGYAESSKAYRIWIPEERKIDIAGDVEFVKIRESPKQIQDDFGPISEEIIRKEIEIDFQVIDNANGEKLTQNDESDDTSTDQDDENEEIEDEEIENQVSDEGKNEPEPPKRGPGRPKKNTYRTQRETYETIPHG